MNTTTLSPMQHKAERIRAQLLAHYGHPDWRPDFAPVDELILTILSANTSDVNSGRAFQQLKATYADWHEVLAAPLPELVTVIRPAGLAPSKAPRLQAALRRILQEQGDFTLDFLAAWPVDEALAWLTQLEGVGHKTASIVLLFCFGKAAFPVDTHVQRVTQRLGLAGPHDHPAKIKTLWESLVPATWFYDLHLNLIRHGRTLCRARTPLCTACPLQADCRYYSDQFLPA
ncbi:MAG: endonuclease III [Caldilineales bacterium]